MEELELENTVLRKTLNQTTKHLQEHQNASQRATQMLAQSVRSLHLSPLTTPENSRGKTIPMAEPGTDLAIRLQQKRIDEREQALQRSEKKMTKREEENAKLRDTLQKYRSKWDDLKAGAKARREGEKRKSSSNAVPTIKEGKSQDEG